MNIRKSSNKVNLNKVLSIISIIIVIPLIATVAYNLFMNYYDMSDKLKKSYLKTSENMVQKINEKVIAYKNILLTLSYDNDFVDNNYKELNQFFTNIKSSNEEIFNIGLLDSNGTVLSSALPFSLGSNQANELWFTESIKNKNKVICKYFYHPRLNQSILVFAYSMPINTSKNEYRTIALALKISSMQKTLESYDKKHNLVINIIDKNGIIIARNIEHEKYIGKLSKALPTYLRENPNFEKEFALTYAVDSVKRYYNFAPITASNGELFLGIGFQDEFLKGDLLKEIYKQVIVYTLILILSLIFSRIIFKKYVSNPLIKIAENSKKFRANRYDIDFNINSGIIEIIDLSNTLEYAFLEIQKYTLQLEELVNLRTNELIENNKLLLKEIEEKSKIEQTILESERKFKAIFNYANVGISLIDDKKRFLEINDKLTEIFGYNLDEFKLKTWIDLSHEETKETALINFNKILNLEITNYNIEKRFVKKDGSLFWGDLSVSSILDSNGEVSMIVTILHDITLQVNAKNELLAMNEKLNELNITKDKFLSIIAHDLKNPLGNFRDVTRLLVDSYDEFSQDEQFEFLKLMKESSKNVYSLLENLLEWSRAQRGQIEFTPININLKLLTTDILQLFKNLADRKDIEIIKDISSSINVFADINMLNTILRNLISNAIKFTNHNGKIIISARTENDFCIIDIQDSGIGMSENLISSLFKISTMNSSLGTDGESGTGLGLILCKEFIEKNGGSISVKSEVGKGTTFSISLRLA